MVDAAKFRALYSRVVPWFHGPGVTPSAHEIQVHARGPEFHGFEGSEEDAVLFDPTFLAVFSLAFLDIPVFFFIPKVRLKWSRARATSLCRGAVKNQPNSKEAVRSALVRLKMDQPPWALPEEPENRASFGFSRSADKILPPWCKDKLL